MSNLLEAAKDVIGSWHERGDVSASAFAALYDAIAAEEQRLAAEQLPGTREWLTEVIGRESIDGDSGAAEWNLNDVRVVILNQFVAVFINEMRVLRNPTRRQVLCLLEAMGVRT